MNNLPHYLVSSGLLPVSSLVDGDLMVAETGRRNRNFKVIRSQNRGLFLKQIKSSEQQAITTLHREASFYRLLRDNPAYSKLRAITPKFVKYDEARRVVVLSLVEGTETLNERNTREQYPETCAEALGKSLATIHSHAVTMSNDQDAKALLGCQLPWPLLLEQTGTAFLDSLAPIGPALSQGIVRQPGLVQLLSALRGEWQYDSVVHGDMKWDNCLVNSNPDGSLHLTVVDWELFDLGYGAWDVAGVFKEYVMLLLYLGSQNNAGTSVGNIQFALRAIQNSALKFWNSYVHTRNLAYPQQYLEQAMKLTGARMVIGVLEYLFGVSQLGYFGETMLETSRNLLQSPMLAGAQLLGTVS